MIIICGYYIKGPALYVYNDASFKREDWRGIRMVDQSIKEEDPLKIGRFGLGFKSIFHLTGIYVSCTVCLHIYFTTETPNKAEAYQVGPIITDYVVNN